MSSHPTDYIHGEFFGRLDADVTILNECMLLMLRAEINEELRRRKKRKKNAKEE